MHRVVLPLVLLMEQLRPNFWRVRFGRPQQGAGKLIDIYFDGERREVVEAKEVEVSPTQTR